MPFIPHTPESLLPRSDSKNPAKTCKGITESGRHCRRSLATSPHSSLLPKSNRKTNDGVLAVLPGDSEHEGAAAFFCWQHKDQAVSLQGGATAGQGQGSGIANNTRLFPLTERTSIDTLVDRLGVLDVQENQQSGGRKQRRKQASRPVRKDTLPQKWQNVQGPLMALPENGTSSEKPSRRVRRRQPGFWESLCCVHSESDVPQVKTRPSPSTTQTTAKLPATVRPLSRPAPPAPTTPQGSPRPPLTPSLDISDSLGHTTSHTQNLLSLIPSALSPQTTSALLVELAKPVSSHDEEGWIYIFWLTPENSSSPDADSVSLLLSNPAKSGKGQRRASEVLQGGRSSEKKILLKIGRASNVQRRMNEWARQCGYNLSLVRYYPYLPSSPLPSPLPSPSSYRRTSSVQAPQPGPGTTNAMPHKVPHAHKVERLIHLELADKRVKKNCEACGKEHREWFEVDATRDGVKGVDEVVRRWVGWAERNT